MSKKDQKQELTQKLGMEFNETTELFSKETLSSMQMNKIVGGTNVSSCEHLQNPLCTNRGQCYNYTACESATNNATCFNYGECGGNNAVNCIPYTTTAIPPTTGPTLDPFPTTPIP